jgi:uncharacterized MAPEG superfamily protein
MESTSRPCRYLILIAVLAIFFAVALAEPRRGKGRSEEDKDEEGSERQGRRETIMNKRITQVFHELFDFFSFFPV